MEFKDKVVLISGATGGMGREIAKLLAEEGCHLALLARNENKLKALVDELKSEKTDCLSIKCDVKNKNEIKNAVESTKKRFGRIDIAILTAGVLIPNPVEDFKSSIIKDSIDINFMANIYFLEYLLPIMKKQKYGRIINMSSSAGRSVSTLGGAHYTASKAAVLGFTRHLAKEVAEYGITANAICPGLIDTEMVRKNCSKSRLKNYINQFPIHRLGKPEEVAELILFLASPEAGYITGASFDINGGDLMI